MAEIRKSRSQLFFGGFFAALCAVVVGGALTGEAIGDSPILTKRGYGAQVPTKPNMPGPTLERLTQERPPDHYPLVTPTGTVPVAELALHGRLRDERQALTGEVELVQFDAVYGDPIGDAEMDRLANGPAISAEPAYWRDAPEQEQGPASEAAVASEPAVMAMEVETVVPILSSAAASQPDSKKGDR